MEVVKRCINPRCEHKGECPHGIKQHTYETTFTEEDRQKDIVRKMFPSINPVAFGCKRYITTQQYEIH